MAETKLIKAYCQKTNKNYCIEVQHKKGNWQAVNFIDLTDEQARKIKTEENVFRLTTNQSILPCYKCGKRNISGCSCAKKSALCMSGKYFYQCVYCNDLIITPPISKEKKILVTSPCYDDIGELLNSMKVSYQPFSGNFDCDILFINCGTSDNVDPSKLVSFVKSGGCVYASDLTDTLIQLAFPDFCNFGGHEGEVCKINAEVTDNELKQIIGNTIEIEFDMGVWAILNSTSGKTLLKAASGNKYSGKPIMVQKNYGKGHIFYTCFHNHAQASEKEEMLLQLLLLKQLGTNANMTIEEMGGLLGINLASMKERFKK
jgi:hypothetical protein